MNLQHEKIQDLCQQLKLEGIQNAYSSISQECAKEEMSFTDCIEKLLKAEQELCSFHRQPHRRHRFGHRRWRDNRRFWTLFLGQQK